MELVAILFVIAIWDVSKSAVRHAREDYRREAGPKTKAKGGKGAGRDPDTAARAHRARGWWLRELSSGFAVTRTGWHAGWLGHKAEADRSRREREEARTLHTEGRRGVLRDVAAFRQRHAAARKEIEDELAAQQAKGSPATGKSAVQSAGDEVERKRKEREQATGAKCPGCGAPEGYEHLDGCDPTAPPLPASGVRTAADYPGSRMFPGMRPREAAASPEVIDTPVRLHNAEDSAHLRPGDKRCEGCDGSGRNGAGDDACPVCRGWGSVPPDPMSPLAAADAVCATCGNKGKPGDPVLADPGGNIHLSHAQEQQESYWDRLNRERARQRAEEEPDADAARNPQPVVRTANGSVLDPNMPRALMTADELAQLDGQPTTTASPTTQGEPVAEFDPTAMDGNGPMDSGGVNNPAYALNRGSGGSVTDTNYTAVLANAKKAAADAEQDAVAASQRRQVAQQHAEEMQAVEVDGATLSSQMELVERLQAAEQAAKETGEHAVAVYTGLQQRHGGLKQAHDDAPVRAAQRGFYEE